MSRSQYEIYLAIKSYINKTGGESPTMVEISEMVNKKPSLVAYNMRKLRELGYISYSDFKRRTVKIVKDFKISYE